MSPNRLLADHPQLAQERLTTPGRWLRDQVGFDGLSITASESTSGPTSA
ncbi:MAG: hypothetical protein ACM4AI_24365 [Acidobacteriota bacterium]